jgi:ribosomal subunit interface protein
MTAMRTPLSHGRSAPVGAMAPDLTGTDRLNLRIIHARTDAHAPSRCPAPVRQVQTGETMRYQISGKQIDIGEALQTHVKTELGTTLDKYAGRPTDAQVVFSRSAHEFVCEAVVHLSTGLTAQAKGHSTEIYAAFEAAREKMDKQLRRYKRRLKDHHQARPEPVAVSSAPAYILAQTDVDEDQEPESLQPIIVAEMETPIQALSVGEAVMQMELAGAPVLVFRNDRHKGLNVVYRREDGNIGWIDPSTTA